MKKLREKCKNKKGFTMVELIVVIVIILVLAAVLVPSLLKYIDKANQANCKADAATIMSQLQADLAGSNALSGDDAVDVPDQVSGVSVSKKPSGEVAAADVKGSVQAQYQLNDDGEVTSFAYNNGKYTAVWTVGAVTSGTASGGWTVAKTVA